MPKLYYYFTLSLFLVGALPISIPKGYAYSFYFMLIVALVSWFRKRTTLLDKDIYYLFYPFLAYALGNIFIEVFHNPTLRQLGRSIDPSIPFLLIIFVVWALRHYRPNSVWFWRGTALGGIIAGLVSGYQFFDLGIRAKGFTHEIQFGDIAMMMSLICLARALIAIKDVPKWEALLLFAGFLGGLLASFFSASRGGWVVLPFLIPWVLWISTKQWNVKLKAFGFVAILSILTLAFMVPSPLKSRITQSLHAWSAAQVDFSKPQSSSLGQRLQMWRYAVIEAPKHTWLGVGQKGWEKGRDQAIKEGRLLPMIKKYNQVHNEYLDKWLKKGLFGVFLFLAMLLFPLWRIFRPHLKSTCTELKSFSAAGIVVIISTAFASLSQAFLTHNSGRTTFVLFLGVIVALLCNHVRKLKP